MKHTSRKTFGTLFQEHYKTGIGVEVGSEQGYNAVEIAKQYKGELHCVDIWKDGKGFIVDFLHNTKGLNVHHHVIDSVAGAQRFADESLDFVYIDDDHSYEGVKRSFNAWLPKVRIGGIVSGHDYGINDCIGVKQFIDEFTAANTHIQMNFTTDDFYVGNRPDLQGLEYQSWWFVKP